MFFFVLCAGRLLKVSYSRATQVFFFLSPFFFLIISDVLPSLSLFLSVLSSNLILKYFFCSSIHKFRRRRGRWPCRSAWWRRYPSKSRRRYRSKRRWSRPVF